jgi:fructoselysine 6-kinase
VPGLNAYATVRIVEGNRVFGTGEVGVSAIRLTEADLAAAAGFDVVHTGECSMIEEDLPRLAAAARLLSFDFSERPFQYVAAHARHAGIVIVSAPGGATGAAGDLARRIQALGPAVVAVTLGASGAVLLANDELIYTAAGPADVVDTLGAGDAFIARLITGIARGEEPRELVAEAARYASTTCEYHGAFGHETPLPARTPPEAVNR